MTTCSGPKRDTRGVCRCHSAVTIIPVLSPQLGLDNEGTFETWLWGIDGIDAGSAWIIAQPIDGEAFGS